ncbi:MULTISPECIES: helix-turn-helix transcriptional regulator [Oceanobacillus]|uniref:Transcriptional regulator n=1 Tax=Oceanobacillus indicireducens TaxID=1004261 RepID=A0A918D0H5_9BACI|nr:MULTISPECIES: helix-turn-helix transcriptional regulator [Oceanobacillus]GGN54314.1 transcriptional regulator [Oceanobacillus indicireducens]
MKNNVKITRIKNSMTQEQLARQVGVTRQTIGLIEKGEYNPSLQLCINLAKSLNKTLDELFWEVDTQ